MVLPKPMRIQGYRCFNHIHRSGKPLGGSFMVLRVAFARPLLLKTSSREILKIQPCRCAVTISSKVSKKAVVRNRLRRLFHDHLRKRLSNPIEDSMTWALISLKPSSLTQGPKPLLKECDTLLREAGLLI